VSALACIIWLCYRRCMTIVLTQEHLSLLQAEVAAGRLESVEDGVQLALDGWMLLEEDDLEWARPLVDEALSSLAIGRGIAGEEFRREIEETISRLKRP
jgi:antitoxin ParD1/3/4